MVGSVCGVAAIGADVGGVVAAGSSSSPQAASAKVTIATVASEHAARRDEAARADTGLS